MRTMVEVERDAPLWEGGPTPEALERDGGTYWVPVEWRDRYVVKGLAVARDRERLNTAFGLPPRGVEAWQTRNFAREVHGLGPIDSLTDMSVGWPSDSIGVPGTYLHFELLDELAREDRQAEWDAALEASRPRCGACREVFANVSGGLCQDCNAARRHVERERDRAAAEQRVGGRLSGRSRADLVEAWLNS